jgi:hypothetical protein
MPADACTTAKRRLPSSVVAEVKRILDAEARRLLIERRHFASRDANATKSTPRSN